jgi:hypothetical protein
MSDPTADLVKDLAKNEKDKTDALIKDVKNGK